MAGIPSKETARAGTANGVGEGGTPVDVTRLTLGQLVDLQSTIENEVNLLQSNAESVIALISRFKESKEAVKALRENKENNPEILMPLTASVYIPGQILSREKFLLDIGTGYYVEVAQDAVLEYCDERINMLSEKLVEATRTLREKQRMLQLLGASIKQKIMEAQQQQQRAAGVQSTA